jgi:hypothetical protein
MIANSLREDWFIKLANGSSQNTVMRRKKYFPDLHGDVETRQKAKITLIGGDEDPLLFSRVFEVKWVVTTSQAELHGHSDVVAMLLQEGRK